MIIGNDIVDLGDPEAHRGASDSVGRGASDSVAGNRRFPARASELARGRGDGHPRFDARVFAPSELATLAASESKRMMRWILWSAKEAAYKAARQGCADVIFSPVRFVVQLNSTLRGFVSYQDRRWPVCVRHRGNCIHALVADDEDGGNTLWDSRRLTAMELDDPSQSVRKFAITTIARRLGVSASDLRIERSGRIPRLLLSSGGAPWALSLSHHGVYAGFACRVDPEKDGLH